MHAAVAITSRPNFHVWNGDDEFSVPFEDVRKLLLNLLTEVPGQNQYIIGPCLAHLVGVKDGNPDPG